LGFGPGFGAGGGYCCRCYAHSKALNCTQHSPPDRHQASSTLSHLPLYLADLCITGISAILSESQRKENGCLPIIKDLMLVRLGKRQRATRQIAKCEAINSEIDSMQLHRLIGSREWRSGKSLASIGCTKTKVLLSRSSLYWEGIMNGDDDKQKTIVSNTKATRAEEYDNPNPQPEPKDDGRLGVHEDHI
jgi:hypothetical protein